MFKKIIKLVATIYALICYRRKVIVKKCDILFFPACQWDATSSKKLAEELENKNFRILYDIVPSSKKIILQRLLMKTKRIAPFLYCYLEYYAAYIIRKYQPRILLTFMEDSVLSIFLKKEIEKINGKVIDIAHGITPNFQRFRMFDFHYYFMFGQSSVDAAFQQKIRYGNTKIIKAGSFRMHKEFTLPINKESKKIVFFSANLRKDIRDIILRNYNLLAKWARTQENYSLVIKLHPLEDETIIKSIFKNVSKVTFLPKEISMKVALADASLALGMWSCALIDAAVLNRPVVIINDSDEEDFLELEKYFLPRARTVEEIQKRIEETFVQYDEYLDKARQFFRRHLEQTVDSVQYIASCIKSISEGKEDFDYITINGTDNYFSRDN